MPSRNFGTSPNIEFVRRPIDRTELLIADEIAICGTLGELVSVRSIAGTPMDENGPVLKKIRNRFFSIARGKQEDPLFEVSYVPKNRMKNF